MSYPTTLMLIGGGGGSPFSFTGEANGARLEKIGVWVATSRIKAVRAWLSDGRVEEFGIPSGPYKEYTFQAGECISSLSLWGNGAGTRLGAILFKTNKGGQFFVKMTKWGLKTEYPADVGSGYCLGIIGRSGADIDLMGFLFLNQVESAVLTEVEYPNINLLIPDVVVESIESATYTNHSSVTQKETIQSSKEVTKTSTWSISASFTATFSITVKAGVPGVSDATTGYTFSIGVTGMYGQTHTEKKTETITTNLDVPPKKKIDAIVTIGRAAFDLPYTGTMVITCTNGSVLQYKVNGTYKGVAYTEIEVKTQESDLPDSECECVTDQITFFGD